MLFISGYLALHGDGGLNVMSYFAILTLYLYIVSFSFGWSVAPWPAMAESVPNHLRSLTMALGMMSNWFFNILISKATPILLNAVPWGTFFIFGILTLAGVVWAMVLFPETGGYAIEDIHQLFEDVVKQSLHDNRWLLKRPPARKPKGLEDDTEAAKALAKKTAADNEKALQNLRYGMIISSALYAILRLILPPHKFPPTFWSSTIYVLTAIPTIVLYRYLHAAGTPKRDAAGTLISPGDDLSQPGLLDACWDVIYVTWGCQVGSSLFGEWFWWLYLSIPVFGGYKAYTSFISPMLGLRQGHPAAAASDPAAGTAGTTGAETTSKRQAKIQKRNEKFQAQQAKSGRR
ncbi:hypothetical protein FRB90_001753 [Tulasnella sp. 427]|nr:hypothetical protein FRB90_001753 [Tulasnella sp. 427]